MNRRDRSRRGASAGEENGTVTPTDENVNPPTLGGSDLTLVPQELSEFDDVKNSCRRRLAGHNQRRRKSTPDPHGGSGSSSGGDAGGNGCRHADKDGRLTGNPPLIR